VDKKTLIAVVLCVLVLVFWNSIAEFLGISKPAPPPQQVQTQDTAAVVVPPPQPITPVPADTLTSPPAIMAAVDTLIPEKSIQVTTPLYELTFSNRGGGLKKIILRQYTYRKNGNVILADDPDDVVPDLETAGGAFRGANLVYQCDQEGFELKSGDAPRKITYTYDNGRGGRIIKSFTINPDRYDFDVDLAIEGIENFGFDRSYQLTWGITPPPTEPNLKDEYGYFKAVAMLDDQVELDKFKEGRMSEELPGSTIWAGLRTKYFAAVMIPRTRLAAGVVAGGTEQAVTIDGKSINVRDLSAGLDMPISNIGSIADAYTIYAGPIHYSTLKQYNIGLEELTSLGWTIIKPFSIAIIWLLPKIYSAVPNYGVVVLIFALLIKILVYPLTRKQTIAMTRLKDLQPKMKDLQERYKNDAAKLNKEMMKLYKEAGANPLSGCLPMLPQMPLFFALFTVFRTTIEFRGASFIGWITDLSVQDPYYILPIIMVITMFIQQKMTATDPKNKMLSYLLPIFFGWLFMNFPAGLVLYWTGFNILSFLETILIRKRMMEAVTVIEEK
jgi:YidC/Oxa1 family membrane protein insertase